MGNSFWFPVDFPLNQSIETNETKARGFLLEDLQLQQQPLQGPLPRWQRREAKVGIRLGTAQLLQPGAQGQDVLVLQGWAGVFGKFQPGKAWEICGTYEIVVGYNIGFMGELWVLDGYSSWEDHRVEFLVFYMILVGYSRI